MIDRWRSTVCTIGNHCNHKNNVNELMNNCTMCNSFVAITVQSPFSTMWCDAMHHCNQHRLRHIRIWCVNICFYCIAEIANPLGMCSNWRELFLCFASLVFTCSVKVDWSSVVFFIEHEFLKLHFCTCRGQVAAVWLRRGEERGKLVNEWCVSKHRRDFIASLVRERSKKAV